MENTALTTTEIPADEIANGMSIVLDSGDTVTVTDAGRPNRRLCRIRYMHDDGRPGYIDLFETATVHHAVPQCHEPDRYEVIQQFTDAIKVTLAVRVGHSMVLVEIGGKLSDNRRTVSIVGVRKRYDGASVKPGSDFGRMLDYLSAEGYDVKVGR